MALEREETLQWAKLLDAAALESREIRKITLVRPELSLEEGYLIQDQVIELRRQRGERIIGMKMGLTSRAKMKQMGVDSPIYGVFTDRMRLRDQAEIKLDSLIHPKIEPEIAFFTERELSGEVSVEQALSACSGVCAAMEIIDSRYLNFEFALPDVVADNCSSSLFVLGTEILRPSELDLGNLGILMELNGRPAGFASSAAIFGHPGASLAELSRMLGRIGRSIPAGSIVLAGGATAAVPLEIGTEVKTTIQDLGSATIHVGSDYGG